MLLGTAVGASETKRARRCVLLRTAAEEGKGDGVIDGSTVVEGTTVGTTDGSTESS